MSPFDMLARALTVAALIVLAAEGVAWLVGRG